MHAPLARHLAHFSAMPLDLPPVDTPAQPSFETGVAEATITLTLSELDGRVRSACDAMLQAERAAHAAAMDARALAHAEEIRAQVEAVDAKVCAEQAALTAQAVETAFAALRDGLATDLAGAVRPLLAEAAAARVIAILMETLEAVLADPDCPPVTLHGPAERLAAIEAALGDRAAVAYAPDDGSEVRISSAGWHARTRWVDALAALGVEGGR